MNTNKKRPSNDDTQAVSIRFPIAMYEKINDMRLKGHRSFNKQVLHLLYPLMKDASEENDE